MATLSNTRFEITSEVNTIAGIETAATSALAAREGNLHVSATTLNKRRGALHDAALLQIIISWARLSPEGRLKITGLPTSGRTQDALEEATNYSVGIGALSIAPKIALGDLDIPRSLALLPAARRMEAAYTGQYDQLQKGRCADLICVSGAERQYLRPLFSKPDPRFVRDKFDLKSTVRGLALQAHPRADELISQSTYAALATLTHELFENTQDHATSDIRLKKYRRHIEAVFVSWLSISDTIAAADFFGNPLLRDYWASVSETSAIPREAVAGLCFSFLDSGPGMASRFLAKEYIQMSEAEEREALLSCLKVHGSTKSSPAAGLGLSEVLQELKSLNGFVRIRSGRLSLFKCFPPGVENSANEDGFLDWFEERPVLSRVSGTLVSVFIPVLGNQV